MAIEGYDIAPHEAARARHGCDILRVYFTLENVRRALQEVSGGVVSVDARGNVYFRGEPLGSLYINESTGGVIMSYENNLFADDDRGTWGWYVRFGQPCMAVERREQLNQWFREAARLAYQAEKERAN